MKQVVVAEDDADVRTFLRELLQFGGYEVTEAPDGAMALQLLDEISPDLVITDLTMPVMDGAELITHLRQIPEHEQTPVLVLTGVGSAHDVVERLRGEPRVSLEQKPVRAREFLDLVGSLLAG